MNAFSLIIISITGILLFLYVFASNNPEIFSPPILGGLQMAVAVCGGIALVNILSFLIVDIWFVRTRRKKPSALLRLVVALFLYGIYAIAILLLLGKDVAALFTTSAVFSVVIGFALQSTLGNFFSGIALRIDQPFQIGDTAIFNDIEGLVVAITWRATTIQTIEGILIHVPNGSLSADSIRVIPSGGKVQRGVDFTLPATFPPQQAIDTVCTAILNEPIGNLNPDYPVSTKLWEYEREDGVLWANYKIFYYPNDYRLATLQTDREILRRIWYALHRQQMIADAVVPDRDLCIQRLSAIDFFASLHLETREVLLRHSHSLLFDVRETFDRDRLPEASMFIILSGCIEIERKEVGTVEKEEFLRFNLRAKNRRIPLTVETVETVARQLARYIGPGAFPQTRETARGITSLYWLYRDLAEEIPDPEQRQEFLALRPSAPVEQLQAGDFFGEPCLFLGQPLVAAKMRAVEETALLVISRTALAKTMNRDERAIDLLSQQFARYQQEYLVETMQMPGIEPLSAVAIASKMRQLYLLTNSLA
ncbi:MAG: mechanosensitive ion channel [Cyanobacteria bacterium SBLK]|nr:mechanosensitive ion channel [Cyanobacteria bacterium SBLK]